MSALAEIQNAEVAVARGARPLLTRAVLDQETEQRQILGEYVKRNMVEGTDYGTIPGTERKGPDGSKLPNRTLLKPGAEKLTDLFRCSAEYEFVEKIVDFDRPLFHYLIRCRIVTRETGAAVAEGFGSCNSRESKYRWRDEGRKCPHCGKAAIIKGKQDYGGGWLCFGKKGGCGAKFSDGDQAIEGQTTGRVENDDIATSDNTILKIAKKRALVDAAIALARCSDMFTQDLEDIVGLPAATGEVVAEKPPAKKGSAAPTPDDKELVETLWAASKKCKNQTDLAAWRKLLDDNRAKLTPAGHEHLIGVYDGLFAQLPGTPVDAGTLPFRAAERVPAAAV